MNIDELIEKYKKEMQEEVDLSSADGDYETTHGNADDILCRLLVDLSYKEIVDLYEKVGKWYA